MATTKPDIEIVSSIGNLLLIQGTFEPISGSPAAVVATEDGWDFSDFVSSIVSFNIDSFIHGAGFRDQAADAGEFYLSLGNNPNNNFETAGTDGPGRIATGNTLLEIIDAGSGYSGATGVTLTGVLSGQTCVATITVSGGALATVKATSNGTGIIDNEPMTVAGGTGGFVRANLTDGGAVSGFTSVKALHNRPSILIKNDNIIRIVDYMDSKIWGDHEGELGGYALNKYKFSLIGRR